jgi:hypothetical protein
MRIRGTTYNSDEVLSGFIIFGVVRFVFCLFDCVRYRLGLVVCCLYWFGLISFFVVWFGMVQRRFVSTWSVSICFALLPFDAAWFVLVRYGLVCFISFRFTSVSFGLVRFDSVYFLGSLSYVLVFKFLIAKFKICLSHEFILVSAKTVNVRLNLSS